MGRLAESDKTARVLLVEDDPALRFGIGGSLRRFGYEVVEADSCASALAAFSQRPDVVVMDLRLPDGDALELLPRLRESDPNIPVFIVTGFGTIDLAVRAVKAGAEDFFTKPVDATVLANHVARAVERRRAQRSGMRPRTNAHPEPFTSRSDAMKRVEEQVEKLRQADCSVLLLGETGTGKSLLARRIHAVGTRQSQPFVDINCAGLARDFVESELFGHERGAFTGAHATKQGLLDASNGGTLFLDEIGDVDIQVQPKLLKVLEEKRFRRMGDVRERSVDVRLIAATHHDLLSSVNSGRFRADLYYRISTVAITVPALRERNEDLIPLAYQMLETLGVRDVIIATEAKQALLAHDWPGNLRELKNVLERANLSRNGNLIRAENLRFDTASMPRLPAVSVATPSSSRTLDEVEREHIRSALIAENGKVEAAARRLGVPRSTLYQRIKAYGITPSKLRKRVSTSDPPDSGNAT